MSTTDQRTADTEASRADRDAWAVPGVQLTGPANPDVGRADADSESDAGVAAALSDATVGGPGGGAHPVVIAVLACLEAMESIRSVRLGTLSAKEIRLMLVAVAQITAAVFGLKMRLLVAGETQRVADLTGAASTGAFLAHLTQIRRVEANGQVKLAHDLERRFPLLGDALARGLVSPEQVKVCVAALGKLPKNLTDDQWAECQQALIDAAQRLDPKDLRTLGAHLWQVIDHAGAEAKTGKDLENEERQARTRASIRFWDNGDGTTGFRGKLPHLQAAMLQKAIQAFASPRRRSNPNISTSQPDDTRHPGAGSGSGSHVGNGSDAGPGSGSGSGPGSGSGSGRDVGNGRDSGSAAGGVGSEVPDAPGPQPTEDRPTDGPEDGSAQWWPPGATPDATPGSPPEPARPASGGGEGQLHRDVRGGDEESPEERETGRTVPYPVRLGHALMDLIERLPRDLLPTYGGAPATIVATMTLEQLRTGLGAATLDTGTAVSAGQMRRLACNAGIIPAVLDGRSQPLDLGREKRLFTPAQRIAMDLRDRGGHAEGHGEGSGCVIEGCDQPASACDAHHLIPWEEGGTTDLEHGILVCPYHHHRIHDSRWRLTHAHGTYRLRRVSS